jgi:hypothetical protein
MNTILRPEPVVAAPPARKAALDPSLHYAVVVGIDEYPALKSLRAARQDARDFKSWLLEVGVPESNIRLVLTDNRFNSANDAIPTKQLVDIALEEIQAAARKRVAESPHTLWPKTRLYLYLSGHGVTPNAREALLLMANAKRGAFGDSVPCSKYMEFYEDVQYFKELVFFADCCRSLAMQTEPVGPPFDRSRQNFGRVSKLLGFAAGFGDLAFEPGAAADLDDPDTGRGYFTRALLEGLRGKAVDKPTRQINSVSLAKYVGPRVLELTATMKPGPQQPQTVGVDPAFPIVFVEAVPVPKYPVVITFPSGFTGPVSLRDGWGNELVAAEVTVPTLSLELEDGLYEVLSSNGVSFQGGGVFRVRGGPNNVAL